nr:antiterminator LoaP [uncultured Schaedlerella sp.]
MWYVIQVRTGTEENIRLQCQKYMFSDVLNDCFIPYFEEKKHIQGKWKIQKRILFPGYVFLDADESEQLSRKLKNVLGLTKLLGTGDEVVPLTEEEVRFLMAFGGDEQIVQISEGIIENSKVIILSGPLTGKEGYIKKIDRHKRKALLEIPLFGRMQRIQVGLEILSKT